jgi:BlaI family penicillinase repressor
MEGEMADVPRISDAEWEVMNVVWDGHPVGASDVVDRLASQRDWSDKPVKTLLGRLVRKGALGFEVEGRRYLYRPKVSRERCVREESRSFVERVLGGKSSPLLAHMVREAELTADEIAELRRVLDGKVPERGEAC